METTAARPVPAEFIAIAGQGGKCVIPSRDHSRGQATAGIQTRLKSLDSRSLLCSRDRIAIAKLPSLSF
jgi:hypothetical protein